MTGKRVAPALLVGLALAAPAAADPPQIKALKPLGARRGESTEVTVEGSNLAGTPKLVADFPFSLDPPAAANKDAGKWTFKVTVPADVPLGLYPIRVRTEGGLSAPRLFAVGQLPQVAEAEENSTFEAAQAVPTPAVVEGQVAGNDVDYFKFSGKKGQRIVVDAQCARIGSGVDPQIRLTTASRGFVASADDAPGLLTDARLVAELPEDGEYVVELSDSRYQGGNNPVYRLVIGEVPVAEEVYPLGGRRGETVGLELRGGTLPGERVAATSLPARPEVASAPLAATDRALGLDGPGLALESAPELVVGDLPELREPADPAAAPPRAAAPVVLNGRIEAPGDSDRFVLAVAPGQKLRLRVHAADLGSALDGQIQVLGAKDAQIATGDDSPIPPLPTKKKGNANRPPTVSPDPSVDVTVPNDLHEITVVVRDLEGRGGLGFPYRLTVEPIAASFEVRLDDPEWNLPRGGALAVPATIVRAGYTGPITLDVPNPPPGVTVRPGRVAEGQAAGVLTLSAAADASFDTAHLDVVATGQGPDGPIVRKATVPVVYAAQGDFPTHLAWQVGVPAAPTDPAPLALDAPAGPIELAHGGEAPIPVSATRPDGAEGALTVSGGTLPAGVTVAEAKLDAKATEATATVKAAPEAPLGRSTLTLVAKGKLGGKDRALDLPAVAIEVVRPVVLELAAPSAEVKPGGSAEVKGKLLRKGGFKGEVTVQLKDLPKGVKAEPVKLAPDASEFTLTLAAEEKAAAATAKANVVPAFQLNGKDYANPPAALEVKVAP